MARLEGIGPAFGPRNPMIELFGIIGGEVDGGIPERCEGAFGAWVGTFRSSGGDAAAAARSREAALQVFEATLPAYQRYHNCRSRHEYYASRKGPLASTDPRTYLLGILARTAPSDVTEPEIVAEYDGMAGVLGPDLLTAITAQSIQESAFVDGAFVNRLNPAFPFAERFYESLLYAPTPRIRSLALLRSGTGYTQDERFPFPWGAARWQEAEKELDRLVATVGQDRVFATTAQVLDSAVRRGPMAYEFPGALAVGCMSVHPIQCFRTLLASDGPRVNMDLPLDELVALMVPEWKERLTRAVTAMRRLQHWAVTFWTGERNFRREYEFEGVKYAGPGIPAQGGDYGGSYNDLDQIRRLLQDERNRARSIPEEIRKLCVDETSGVAGTPALIEGWTNCQVYTALWAHWGDLADETRLADQMGLIPRR